MTPEPATLKKRSVTIAGHATSVSMENIFWDRLTDIAKTRNQSVSSIIREVDTARAGNLSSALRVYVLENS
jgi:predicted DNA-binding ribbon-helix-helix protein